MIGSGKNRYQLLDVEDLCQAIYLCMTLPDETVERHLQHRRERVHHHEQDYQAVLDEAGNGKQIIGFPADAGHLGPALPGRCCTSRRSTSGSTRPPPRTRSSRSRRPSALLGYKPKYSNKDALVRNYKWYIAHRDQFEAQSGVSHRVPWKQGALGLLKRVF